MAGSVGTAPTSSESESDVLANKLRAKVQIFNTKICKRPLRLVRLCFIEKQIGKKNKFHIS